MPVLSLSKGTPMDADKDRKTNSNREHKENSKNQPQINATTTGRDIVTYMLL